MRPLRNVFTCSLFAVLAISFCGIARSAEEKVKVLIVTGFDHDSHQWEASTKLVHAILEKTGRFHEVLAAEEQTTPEGLINALVEAVYSPPLAESAAAAQTPAPRPTGAAGE